MKILHIGSGPLVFLQFMHPEINSCEIIPVEKVVKKERSIGISESKQYLITARPELGDLKFFEERKNYINGKKLPRKKNRKK